jgi:muconate cycloisomerase
MRITDITTTPLALPFKEPYHWAGRVDYGVAVVLVETHTDEGIIGIGESTAALPAEPTIGALRGVAPLFVGEPVHDVRRLLKRARFLGSFSHTP